MIRTIIVDDEILSRIGMQTFLDGKEDIEVSGVFGEAAEALTFLRDHEVDVILTDIEMTDIDGLELIRRIREEQPGKGIIIVSCHDDFSYAQRAISLGIDSYILKHSVTEEMLIREVKKAYQKTCRTENEVHAIRTDSRKPKEKPPIRKDSIYRIAVLKLEFGTTMFLESGQSEGDMLIHLLEGIIQRYQMGTLFAPCNHELFLLFQWDKEEKYTRREELLHIWIQELQKNVRQYLNRELFLGISEEYEELPKTRENYENALLAVQQSFYGNIQKIFFTSETSDSAKFPPFSTEHFLEKYWIDSFCEELLSVVEKARKQHLPIQEFKGILIRNLNRLMDRVLQEYCFSETLREKWNVGAWFTTEISAAESADELQREVIECMNRLHEEICQQNERDDLTKVLEYIELHLEEKLTLAELAEMGCMSVPSFSKKFKERTGITLVQYLNEKRIERTKLLMQQKRYTLEQIAELAGFSNTNYMLRVFKKLTGQTIGDYRRNFGIRE